MISLGKCPQVPLTTLQISSPWVTWWSFLADTIMPASLPFVNVPLPSIGAVLSVTPHSVSSADHSIALPSVSSLKWSALARLPLCDQRRIFTTISTKLAQLLFLVDVCKHVRKYCQYYRFPDVPDVPGLQGRFSCQRYWNLFADFDDEKTKINFCHWTRSRE